MQLEDGVAVSGGRDEKHDDGRKVAAALKVPHFVLITTVFCFFNLSASYPW